MPSIDDIAAEYVARSAALDPFFATYAGIAGHDHALGWIAQPSRRLTRLKP